MYGTLKYLMRYSNILQHQWWCHGRGILPKISSPTPTPKIISNELKSDKADGLSIKLAIC